MQQGRSLATLITCGVLALAGCRDTVQITDPTPTPPGGQPAYASAIEHLGQWSPAFPLEIIATHLTLLPNGKVIYWTSDDQWHDHTASNTADVYLWDPATGLIERVPNTNTDLFCSAHAFLPDGNLLVSGGHITDERGSKDSNIFNFRSGTWGRAASMRAGRWYPSSITLASGEVITLGGSDENKVQNTLPEVWSRNQWWELPDASRLVPWYPWIFQAPDGRVLMAGPDNATLTLRTSGRGWWEPLSNRLGGERKAGTAVMYEPGKVLVLGGDNAKRSAEVLNLNAGTAWQFTDSMHYGRRHANATILANGHVLVTGGHTGDKLENSAAVYPAEIWNPSTGTWTPVASMKVPRMYHSTAILLPDARVLSAGGGRCNPVDPCDDYPNGEIYSPPYLFNADGSAAVRPSIADAPGSVGYGQSFSVKTPDASAIGKVTLVRLSSVTHGFNMNQRFNDLAFSPASGAVTVTAPSRPELAPPGHYLLFILNSRGVPSVSRVIELQGGTAETRVATTPVISRQSGKCMDVDGTDHFVQIWECHGGSNQKWTVPASGATGEVRGYRDRCLDISGSGNDGDPVVTAVCDGGAGQRWTYTAVGELRGANGKCVNVAGANTANGTRLVLWTCTGASSQKWGPSTGPVVSQHSQKCMDVDGTAYFVQIWACHGNDNQKWRVPATGVTGVVRAPDGRCLEASGAGNDGDPINTSPCNGAANQKWTYASTGDLRGINGKCVDVGGANTANGTRLVLYTCHGGGNQNWGFAGPTTGPAVSQHSGKCMDVDGAAYFVQIWGCHGGVNQQWTVPATGVAGEVRGSGDRCLDTSGTGNDGDQIITSPCNGASKQQWTYTPAGELRGINGKCVDVNGSLTADGTRLVFWACNGNANQKWTLSRR